jgi:CheY-like chemotaxis protein
VKTVLLVDDEFALTDTLKEFLEQEGYLVECACNGKEALESMTERCPDLVVSDLMMPLVDGKALLRAIRDTPDFKSIPVVLTSAARRQIVLPAEENLPEFSAFLRKPFQLDEFLGLVTKLIGPGGKPLS